MIKLSSFKPEFFNNNGDQGNLEVLECQLDWRGVSFNTDNQDFVSADFLLVGDASRAVIRHFDKELLELAPVLEERLPRGLPTLLVGSAFEFYAGRITGLPALKTISRASEFRTVEQSGIEAYGYRNSEVDQDLFLSGAFVGTTLYGPVLAKSPQLLSLILRTMGVEDELPVEISSELDLLLREVRKTNAG